MGIYANLYFNSEEVPVEQADHVYMDSEFHLRLPEKVQLKNMPKMLWTHVRFFLFPNYYFLLQCNQDYLSILYCAFRPKKPDVSDSTVFPRDVNS